MTINSTAIIVSRSLIHELHSYIRSILVSRLKHDINRSPIILIIDGAKLNSRIRINTLCSSAIQAGCDVILRSGIGSIGKVHIVRANRQSEHLIRRQRSVARCRISGVEGIGLCGIVSLNHVKSQISPKFSPMIA